MNSQTTAKQTVSITDVAEMLDCSPTTVRAMVRRGNFPRPAIVGSRLWRWPVGVVDEWLRDQMAVGE